MDDKIISIAKEILGLEDFNLYMYYKYITEYGNDTITSVFSYILKINKYNPDVFNKYFDAFFSIELENLVLTSCSVLFL